MKTHLKLIFLLTTLLTLALMLAACGGGAKENNETDADAAITHVVETAMMAITQTEAVQPATSTPLPSSTPLPTATQIPTMAASPTSGASFPTPTTGSSQPSNPTSSCDVGNFVADVTIPDGTAIDPSTKFTKTWEIKNGGTCTWNIGYQVVFYGGTQMAGETIYTFTDKDIAPGESANISVEMTSPAATGSYTSYWILRNDRGQNFFVDGGSIYVQISVGATPVPGPSATPGGNTAPTISISANKTTITAGQDVQFTAVTDDNEDNPFNPTINWYVVGDPTVRKTGSPANIIFATAGTYKINAKVTDSDSNTTTSNELTITVNP